MTNHIKPNTFFKGYHSGVIAFSFFSELTESNSLSIHYVKVVY